MTTEENNPKTRGISSKRTEDIVRIINEEDFQAFEAVKASVTEIAKAADICLSGIKKGGRVIYVGAGTSGRIAVQDIVELDPTYGLDSKTFLYVMAGGLDALLKSQEGSEDDTQAAVVALKKIDLKRHDIVVGISASGRTPFVLAALKYGNGIGSSTIGIVNNPGSVIEKEASHCIVLDTGPEVIQGSTRMKAGTAQKLTLNAMSTTIAIKLGRVYDNMMSYMGVTFNAKLKERAISFLINEFAVSRDDAIRTLEKSDYKLWAAIDRLKAGRSDEGSSKSAEN
ncbi:MAG: N-acetylmuramic acid 6-phosphate etherase [Thermoplasmataceae archaeon]